MHTPQLIAHRGDASNFSENTLEAFESAFIKGADGVEMDVQLLAGEVCIVHNYLLEPTKTYPLLRDVLKKIGDKGMLEIEVKSFSTDILPVLKDILVAFDPTNIEITTSELPLVPYIATVLPNCNIGVIFSNSHYQEWMTEELYLRKTIGLMTLMKAQVAHLSHLPEEKVTTSLITSLRQNSFKTHYHIRAVQLSEQIKLYQKLKNSGVDHCTFDDITLLTAL